MDSICDYLSFLNLIVSFPVAMERSRNAVGSCLFPGSAFGGKDKTSHRRLRSTTAHCNGSTSFRDSGVGFGRRVRRSVDLMPSAPQQTDAQTTMGVEAPSTEMLAPVR